MNFNNFKKEVQTRANNFFSSKHNSLNISAYKFTDDYINVLKSHRLCILDTETTGLNENDKLWQISIRVIMNNKQIDELYEMFKPANYDSLNSSEYTNIIKRDTENLNYIPLQKINNFIAKYNNSVFIAHNISFDIPHCENEHIIFPEDCYYFDTMWIIKNVIPSMSKLCVFNKVDCDSKLQHNAHYDTRLLKDCVINWLNNYKAPIKFRNGEQNLYKLVRKLEDPSCKITEKDKDTFENSLEKLKSMNYTIFHNKTPINITDSYYKVIINKTACYIDYNYSGEDIKKNVEEVSIEFTPSEEQSKIISAIKDNNITVDAVAGSGKTTTALFIAKEYPNKKILLLTYNKHLQINNEEKCSCCKNIDVFTFHAFCSRIYKTKCINDLMMYECVNSDSNHSSINYDIIIIDEAQDMTDIMYLFIKKILPENSKLMLVGDKYQNIYRFNGATSEYLEHPEKYFDRTFTHLTLQMSYRLTNQMSNFINRNVMHQERIKTCKEGDKVSIVFSFDNYIDKVKYFSNKIIELIKSGVDINDIMVLSYSVRNPSAAKCVSLIKKLTKIDVYLHADDDSSINEECCKNKLLFSSIHQSKGLERDYIFLLTFDTGYCYAWNDYLHELNNLFYVALTRAKKKLTIFIRNVYYNFSNKKRIYEPFPFISFTDEDYIEYHNKIIFEPTLKEEDISPRKKTDVSSICKFVSSEIAHKLQRYIDVEEVPSKRIKLNIQSISNNEEVSDISGNAVTAMFGINDINVIKYINELKKSYCKFKKDWYKHDYVKIPDSIKTIKDMLKLMTYVEYNDNELVHKPLQLSLSDFNWITNDQYEIMKSVAEENLKGFGSFEKPINVIIEKVANCNKSVFNNNIVLNNKYSIDEITGRIDMINNDDDIVEFKLVNTITNTHIYQALLYAFMKNKNTALIYNIKSGELLRITCNHPQEVLELLLEKYMEK